MADSRQKDAGRRDTLDFAGFAQEFLRRNPDYRRDFQQTVRDGATRTVLNDQEVMARRWGLCFP